MPWLWLIGAMLFHGKGTLASQATAAVLDHQAQPAFLVGVAVPLPVRRIWVHQAQQ